MEVTEYAAIDPNRILPPTLSFGPELEDLRAELREWISRNDPGDPPESYEPRMAALVDWQASLHEAGFVGLSWPVEFGGRGLGLAAEAVLCQELAASSMPQLINRLALYTWGPTVLDWGTEDQKRRLLGGVLDASEIWCQGFSEPDAGSDLASVRTSGRLEGDVVVVNGQKVWTSRAELSKWNALLIRTEQSPNRHAGLTLALVDMELEGISVQPLRQMLDEPHFSEVFFDDVEIPVENILGGLGQGWKVAMAAMGYERGLFVLERLTGLRRRFHDLVELLNQNGRATGALADLGRLQAKLDLLEAQVFRTLAQQIDGSLAIGATSVDKLFLAEVYQDLFATAYDHLGTLATAGESGWIHDLLESRSVSIYSGTSEIQKNVIVSQLLGIRP